MAARLIPLVAAAWLLAGAPVAAAQTVEGTVVDPDRERPIPGARVILMDPQLTFRDSTLTEAGGGFRLSAPGPGDYVLVVRLEGHLTVTDRLDLEAGDTVVRAIEMPVISVPAARIISETIEREAALQLPFEELCEAPLRPWEAGVLVGVTRDRSTLGPIPGVLVTIEPVGVDDGAPGDREDSGARRSRLSTGSGTFWFCNVPAGRVRLVVRADGFRPDTTLATIRAGTVSWYDAILRR